VALAALVAAAVGVGAAVLITPVVSPDSDSGSEGRTPEPSGSPSKTALSAADCPVRAANPPWEPPAREGDSAAFIGDITLPDCTRVGFGQTTAKIWRLKNTGSVRWKGYSLRRLDSEKSGRCQTPSDIPIEDTPPGETVDIRTDITTSRKPGFCYARFKMMNGSGRVAFPGGRPLNFQVIVE